MVSSFHEEIRLPRERERDQSHSSFFRLLLPRPTCLALTTLFTAINKGKQRADRDEGEEKETARETKKNSHDEPEGWHVGEDVEMNVAIEASIVVKGVCVGGGRG